MKTLKPFFLLSFLLLMAACSTEEVTTLVNPDSALPAGYWQGELTMQGYAVPFTFLIDENQEMTVFNSDEKVKMLEFEYDNDSIAVYFKDYPTFLKFKLAESGEIKGYFLNPDIGENMHYPFHGKYIGKEKQNRVVNADTIGATWETYFRPNTDRQYPAIGQFHLEDGVVKGTFLKPSGDARFLAGTFQNDTLQLSSFDGSYVALYLAHLQNDTLYGKYISRNQGEIEWMAWENENFELTASHKRTTLVQEDFVLNLTTLSGESYTYPNPSLEGKTVIIQILGTWCPNCLDEGDFFKELYEQHNKNGLEILGVAYERPTEFKEQVARVERLVKMRNYPYTMLIGGDLASNKIAEDFAMLDKVSAFPTALFINKHGDIVRIETGFSGPGTGELHEKHKQELRSFVAELLEL